MFRGGSLILHGYIDFDLVGNIHNIKNTISYVYIFGSTVMSEGLLIVVDYCSFYYKAKYVAITNVNKEII